MGNNNHIRLLQANLQHAKAASYLLGKKIRDEQLDIALLQEPWTSNTGLVKGLGSTSGKVIAGSGDRPRACIFIRNNINYFVLSEFRTQDVVAVQLSLVLGGSRVDIIACSAYFPGDRDAEEPPPAAVRALIDYSKRKNIHLVIGCDANSHHTAWGSTNINHRGEILFDYILGEGLSVSNTGSEPTFVTKTRREVLDITITSFNLSNKITDWRVSKEPSCADHRHIQFNIEMGPRQEVRYRNPRGTDWQGYKQSLQSYLSSALTTIRNRDEIEIAAEQIRNGIISAYHENSPLKVKKDNRGSPWWNSKLEKKRKEVRRLFNRAKAVGAWEQYRTALTDYNKEIRRAKRESWRRFCEGVTDLPSSNRIHKIISREPAQAPGTIKRPDGSFTGSVEETLELLISNHFPGSSLMVDHQLPQAQGRFKRPGKDDWKVAGKVITAPAVEWAVKSFQPYKSPGEDGIFPALLQNGLEILLSILIKIFRASLAWRYIPSSWSAVRVVYIPKLGRTDPNPKSFRPISLTSFLLKSLEKVLDGYVRENILINNPLSIHQYAYQPGKSTELALNNLVGKITRAFQRKDIAVAAFLDIEGAFNNALPDSLYTAGAARGIEPILMDWIRAMLENRTITTSLQGETVSFRPGRGCPQGGVLSPLLWSLLVDDLLAILAVWEVEVLAYADDLVILITGNSEEDISYNLQEVLNTLSSWCEREQMSVNPRKTVIVPFTRRRRLDKLKPPSLSGEIIPFAEEAKYLGLTLDKSLTWNSHLERVIHRARLSLWTCRRICGKSWGIGPQQMYWIYVTVVRPMIAYGAIAWWTKGLQRTAKTKLSSLQRLASLTITGAISTTPSAAMEILLDLTPLHIYLEREARWATYRLHQAAISLPQANVMEHSRLLDDIESHSLLGMLSDVKPTTISRDLPFNILFPGRDEWDQNKTDLLRADSCWFTDGSRTPEGTGAGVYSCKPRVRISSSLGTNTTIFQAEVHAIELCVRRVERTHPRRRTIKIFSDSQAALKALGSYRCNSKTVWNCQRALTQLGRQNKVTLVWIPGHSGMEGNEIADSLARQGAESLFIGPEPALGIALSTAKSNILAWADRMTCQYWQEIPGLVHSKAFIGYPLKSRSKKLLELNRLHLKTLVGLYTGHCRLNHHLHRIGLAENAECRLCLEDDETAEHILCHCPAAERTRFSIFGKGYLLPWDLDNTSPNKVIDLIKRLNLLGEI